MTLPPLPFGNRHTSVERANCRLCGAWREKSEMQPLRVKQLRQHRNLVRYLCGSCISLILQEATK